MNPSWNLTIAVLLVTLLVVGALYYWLRRQTSKARNLKEQNRPGASVSIRPGTPPTVILFGEMTTEDRILLAVGAVANAAYVINVDSSDVKRVLYGVFRAALATIDPDSEESPQHALEEHLASVRNAGGASLIEGLTVALIHGEHYTYTITDFPLVGRPQGIALAVAHLFSTIAQTLNGHDLHRLQLATLLVASFIYDGMIGKDNQEYAFSAVEASHTMSELTPITLQEIRDLLARHGA